MLASEHEGLRDVLLDVFLCSLARVDDIDEFLEQFFGVDVV